MLLGLGLTALPCQPCAHLPESIERIDVSLGCEAVALDGDHGVGILSDRTQIQPDDLVRPLRQHIHCAVRGVRGLQEDVNLIASTD